MIYRLLQDLLVTLSTLLRGSIYEKLRWTFKLYDINGDGCITRAELAEIVVAIHELMGRRAHQVRATGRYGQQVCQDHRHTVVEDHVLCIRFGVDKTPLYDPEMTGDWWKLRRSYDHRIQAYKCEAFEQWILEDKNYEEIQRVMALI
jgi:hypothetical protein